MSKYSAKCYVYDDYEYYSIFRIPIISEFWKYPFDKDHVDDNKNREIVNGWIREYSRDAIQAMYDFHKELNNDIQCFIGHKEYRGQDKPAIGLMRVIDIGELPGFGLTIFGDTRFICHHDYKLMMTGSMSQYSAETYNNDKTGIIEGLAFLDTTPPKFQYPSLTHENIITAGKETVSSADNMPLLVTQNSVNYRRNQMPEETETEKKPVEGEAEDKAESTQNEGGDLEGMEKAEAVTLDTISAELKDVHALIEKLVAALVAKSVPDQNQAPAMPGETINQMAAPNPNTCSRKLVDLARAFPAIPTDTLEKLDKAGLGENEIKKFFVNADNKKQHTGTGGDPKAVQNQTMTKTECQKKLEEFKQRTGMDYPYSERLENHFKEICK